MLTYLSSPYTHESAVIRRERFIAAQDYIARQLLGNNAVIFSPIVHYHHLAIDHNLPGDFEFWQSVNRFYIDASETIHVLKLAGWSESIGVRAEIEYGIHTGKLIYYVDP